MLGDELLETVVLDGATDLGAIDAALVREGDVEGEEHRRGPVDGHGGGDPIEGDPVEEDLHVLEGVDGDAAHPHLAEAPGRIAVVAHERREIEGGGQARLPLLQEVAESLVGLRRRTEAREHAHRPEAPAVHRRLNAAGEGILARKTEVGEVLEVHVRRGDEVRDLHVAQRAEPFLARGYPTEGLLHRPVDPLATRFADGTQRVIAGIVAVSGVLRVLEAGLGHGSILGLFLGQR